MMTFANQVHCLDIYIATNAQNIISSCRVYQNTRVQPQARYNYQVHGWNAVELTTHPTYLLSTMLRSAMSVASDSDHPSLSQIGIVFNGVSLRLHLWLKLAVLVFQGFEISLRRRLAYVTPLPSPSKCLSRTGAQLRPCAVPYSDGLDSIFLAAVLDHILPDGRNCNSKI
jgi:hypothetical protein